MNTICVAGMQSTIVAALKTLRPDDMYIRCPWNLRALDQRPPLPRCDRYLYAAGVIRGRSVREYDGAEAVEAFAVNYWNALRFTEAALLENPRARICLIGSMSAITGSYDEIYSGLKAALHLYVKTRRVQRPAQQLFCVSPTIIADSAMTRARIDYPKVLEKRSTVTAMEVAQVISCELWNPDVDTNNEVMEMHGRLRSLAAPLKNPPQILADPAP